MKRAQLQTRCRIPNQELTKDLIWIHYRIWGGGCSTSGYSPDYIPTPRDPLPSLIWRVHFIFHNQGVVRIDVIYVRIAVVVTLWLHFKLDEIQLSSDETVRVVWMRFEWSYDSDHLGSHLPYLPNRSGGGNRESRVGVNHESPRYCLSIRSVTGSVWLLSLVSWLEENENRESVVAVRHQWRHTIVRWARERYGTPHWIVMAWQWKQGKENEKKVPQLTAPMAFFNRMR